MKTLKTPLEGLLIVELNFHGDERGFFVERFHEDKFAELGLPTHYPQDNHSRSERGVLRGLHCQHTPAQGKLVGVIRGSIWDVAVDIRPYSPTYGSHFGVDLTDTNGKLLWIPAGFAHGFCTTSEGLTDVLYKTTAVFTPEGETGIAWDDPEIAIDWPIENPIISARDQNQKSFKDYNTSPPNWKSK